MTILPVSKKLMNEIIEKRTPLGKFYSIDKGVFIGCDNSRGEAFVEEFNDLDSCKKWLNS